MLGTVRSDQVEQFWQHSVMTISVMAQSLILSFSNGTKFAFELHALQLRIGVMHAV